MKRTFLIIIVFLSLFSFYSCKNWNEIQKKDHALQELIDKIPFDKEFMVLEKNYKYLFDRLDEDSIERNGYKIKFGQKEYFVAQNDESFHQYALEDDSEGYYLMISMRKYLLAPKGPEISIMIVKKMEDLND